MRRWKSRKLKPDLAMKQKCPVCGKPVEISSLKSYEKSDLLPFCSGRCKLIDLGAWLDAEYKISSQLPPRQAGDGGPDG